MKSKLLFGGLVRVILLALLSICCPTIAAFAADTINTGSKVTFTATADGTQPITYEWFRNGVKVGDGNPFVIDSVQLTDAGTYRAKATNVAGSADSDTLDIIVVESTPPVFALQPTNQIALPGASVTFASLANAIPAPTYQWYRDGVAIDGATGANLTIASATLDNTGAYSVVAANRLASTLSSIVSLQLYSAPVFAIHPVNQSADIGATVTFASSATGNPSPTYQWFKNEVLIGGATSATLTLPSVTIDSAGSYSVVASNRFGEAGQLNNTTSNAGVLTINALPPVIAQHPIDQSVKVGSPVTFAVVATGTSPNYQWQKNGVNIAGATSATYTIAAITSADAASYRVVVSNAAGTVVSNAAVLTVLYPPIFVQQPKTTVIVALGSPLLLESLASGWPAPRYAWMKNSNYVAGAVEPNFYIPSVISTDGGTYLAVASNTEGSVNSSPSQVTVTTSPLIVTRPANLVVRKFGTATFTVVASGSAPLTYQWRKGNTLLRGQNSPTLTLTNVNNPDAGSYTVTVSNSLGSTSATATLIVTNR